MPKDGKMKFLIQVDAPLTVFSSITFVLMSTGLIKLHPNLRIYLTKFRCSSHNLPVEAGRLANIPLAERICHLCSLNSVGDEFHYLFLCPYFSEIRNKYLDKYYLTHPNIIKFDELFNSTDKITLVRLAAFCKVIIKAFN